MPLENMTTATEHGQERDEYRTPPEIFEGLGCQFTLDVAAPSKLDSTYSVPAMYSYDVVDDGLISKWFGFVWMNPPFGPRNSQVAWLEKFFEHGNGIGLLNALTSSGWFHDWMPKATALFFPRGKTKFIRPDGSIARQPANGIVLFAAGEGGKIVLQRCSLEGMYLEPKDGG